MLPTKNSESCSIISSAKTNESFTVYSLLIKTFKIGTRIFLNLYVEVLIADKISRRDGNYRWCLFELYDIFVNLYELCEDIINNCSSFRPILSAINTLTYKLAKFLVPILNL